MNRMLDRLYLGAGLIAGLFMILIALLILAQIVGRLFGFLVPGADEFAGFSMAASTFLALSYALRHGDHIRVSLVIQRLSARSRRWIEMWCLGVATLCLSYFAWFAFDMTWESYVFGDVSQGLVKTPLWVPQTAMSVGLALMALAFLEELIGMIRGRPPSYEPHDPSLRSDAGQIGS